jgi:HAT1-interacting factor 1
MVHNPPSSPFLPCSLWSVCKLILGESFDAAVQDLTRALELKLAIYPPSDPIISEAHYKLSLALEFAPTPSTDHNKTLALQHLESAISSVRAHATDLHAAGKTKEAKDAEEMIEELQTKVDEMKNPTAGAIELNLADIFGGGSAAALAQSLAQATSSAAGAGMANDLTGLVRKKDKVGESSSGVGEKRKIEGGGEAGSPGKKVRVEDVEDEEA